MSFSLSKDDQCLDCSLIEVGICSFFKGGDFSSIRDDGLFLWLKMVAVL